MFLNSFCWILASIYSHIHFLEATILAQRLSLIIAAACQVSFTKLLIVSGQPA